MGSTGGWLNAAACASDVMKDQCHGVVLFFLKKMENFCKEQFYVFCV
jgi:hypothetical protein